MGNTLQMIVLGAVQGFAEWLPVSSEGMLVLVQAHFFDSQSLVDSIQVALFLHMGTVLASIVYFWSDVVSVWKTMFRYRSASNEEKKLFTFLFTTTAISGVLGYALLQFFVHSDTSFWATTSVITGAIGFVLIGTGILLAWNKRVGTRGVASMQSTDGVVLGFVQGLAALPGASRSGLTVSALLLLKVSEEVALKLSFLMSIPLVLVANVVLNYEHLSLSLAGFAGLASAFVFGYITIDLFLRIARRISFGPFVIGFGVLMVLAALIA